MTAVVVVHGISFRSAGRSPGQAAVRAAQARKHLEEGLAKAGLGHVPLPDVEMAYYAHELTDDRESQSGGEDTLRALSPGQQAEAWELLRAAGVPEPQEPQGEGLLPLLRWGIGELVRRRAGKGPVSQAHRQFGEMLTRVVVAFLRDADAYLSRPERRRAVRRIVANAIGQSGARVAVAHSLGSVVLYEALHAFPTLELDLLITVGSPLGLPALMRKLEPEPRAGKRERPPGIGRWVNIADVGDIVAVPDRLGGAFLVERHAEARIGPVGFHSLDGYLAEGTAAAAMAPYLMP